MPIRLDTRSADFGARFHAFLGTKRETSQDVEAAVRAIMADVLARGDAALVELTKKFDRVDLDAGRCACASPRSMPPIHNATARRSRRCASRTSASRPITGGSCPQTNASPTRSASSSATAGRRSPPSGFMFPGGTAAYPSSVLMNAVPAKVAGVARLVMVVPAPEGQLNPLVLAAARLAGVDEIFRVGGAQAIAALAYGTESIRAGRQDRRARATRMWRRRSGWCSARSAST